MPAQELTGRRRYRQSQEYHRDWGGAKSILILQVEVSVWASSREDKPGRWVNQWRDATFTDVRKEELV